MNSKRCNNLRELLEVLASMRASGHLGNSYDLYRSTVVERGWGKQQDRCHLILVILNWAGGDDAVLSLSIGQDLFVLMHHTLQVDAFLNCCFNF